LPEDQREDARLSAEPASFRKLNARSPAQAADLPLTMIADAPKQRP
jgi:hypothetical protein